MSDDEGGSREVIMPGAIRPKTVPLKDRPGGTVIGVAHVRQTEDRAIVADVELNADGA